MRIWLNALRIEAFDAELGVFPFTVELNPGFLLNEEGIRAFRVKFEEDSGAKKKNF